MAAHVPATANDAQTPEAGSVASQLPAVAVVPANAPVPAGNAAADVLGTKITIHVQQSSSPARTDAQKLALSRALSGFGTAQMRSTQHAPRDAIVRYL